jgi:hypothetical protein
MTTTTTTPDVPWPPDMTENNGPEWNQDGERRFWGTDRDGVWITGFQKEDGQVRYRWITPDFDVAEMSAAEARDLGCRLIAAADELERIEAGEASE